MTSAILQVSFCDKCNHKSCSVLVGEISASRINVDLMIQLIKLSTSSPIKPLTEPSISQATANVTIFPQMAARVANLHAFKHVCAPLAVQHQASAPTLENQGRDSGIALVVSVVVGLVALLLAYSQAHYAE